MSPPADLRKNRACIFGNRMNYMMEILSAISQDPAVSGLSPQVLDELKKRMETRNQIRQEIEKIRGRLMVALGLGGVVSINKLNKMGSRKRMDMFSKSSLPLLLYSQVRARSPEYCLFELTALSPREVTSELIARRKLGEMVRKGGNEKFFVRLASEEKLFLVEPLGGDENTRSLAELLVHRHAFVQRLFHPLDSMPFRDEKKMREFRQEEEIESILEARAKMIEALYEKEQALMRPFGLGGVMIRPEFESKRLLGRLAQMDDRPLLLVTSARKGDFCLLEKASGPAEPFDLPFGDFQSYVSRALKESTRLKKEVFIRKGGQGDLEFSRRIAVFKPPDQRAHQAFALFRLLHDQDKDA